MNALIVHRGPDSEGIYSFSQKNFSIGMAMRRLSIIDLHSGDQPIFTADEEKVIVFNGEIYNYKELRDKYLTDYKFRTNSDTEVLLALYDKFGVNAFSMLDGMFAFSVFDKTINKLYIARDFFGEKPLYYVVDGDKFYWGSELKSLRRVLTERPAISIQGLNLYFQLSYIPAPYTIYENVFKLEANHFVEFDCSNFSFSISEIPQNLKSDYVQVGKTEVIKINEKLVRKSVETRSVSDVPIGTFLSGGVDSSIVSLCLSQQTNQRIDTFSIGFAKKSFDETFKARTVSKLINSRHHEFLLSDEELRKHLDNVILNFDEPYADSSALPTYLVASKTKMISHVALTGDGGDEIYGGYNKYYMGKLNSFYTNIVPKKLHLISRDILIKLLSSNNDDRDICFKAKKFLNSVNYESDYYFDIISLGFLENERNRLFMEKYYKYDSLKYYKDNIGNNVMSLSDFKRVDKLLSLEGDLLVKVDRMSMMASLECRAPFLNKELWAFTNALPDKYLLNGWDKKHLLKESFKDFFPTGFLNKSKQGFGLPIGDWMRNGLREELLMYIDKTFIGEQNIFNFHYIHDLVMDHLNGKVDNTFRVFTYFCFQKWYLNTYDK
jgi:asparagine synthase (glutamine-hydrolysing)